MQKGYSAVSFPEPSSFSFSRTPRDVLARRSGDRPMTEEQRTLEGLVVTSRDALKDAIREVLREEGIVGTVRRAGEHWDHAYKGDEFWLEFRGHVVALLQSNVAVGYRDLDQDGYFVKKAALREVKQWLRAIDAHLVPNRPRGADGLDLVTF